MNKVTILYDQDADLGLLYPVFLLLDVRGADWSETIYVNFMTAFDRLTVDQVDHEVMSMTVPITAYVRPTDKPDHFGIHLPALQRFIKELENDDETGTLRIDRHEVERLNLRIGDIEEIMQFEVLGLFQW